MLDTTKLSDQAFALGRERGVNAGSWVIDGNTTQETARAILKGIEDGDPQVMDMEPAPLSGEWADSRSPEWLAQELDLTEIQEDEELDDLCSAYGAGFSDGYWDEVERSARAIL